MKIVFLWSVLCAVVSPTAVLCAQEEENIVARGDSVTIRLIDVDLRAAVQALARYLDGPVVFGALNGERVTVETPTPVPVERVADLLRGVLVDQNFELVRDSSGTYRVRSVEQETAAERGRGRRQQEGVPELFIIRLRHARAADVAATVNALYGKASALGEIGADPATLADELRRNRVPEQEPPPQVVPGAAGRAATLTGEITIVPDPLTNSLLIRATRSDFELIQAVVEQVDVRPLQVLIEVMIVEARGDRSWAFGVASELAETELEGTGTTISGSVEGIGLGDFVLQVMSLGGLALDHILTASAARGDVAIVSRPVVLVANNDVAEIAVGSQRPFVQVSRSLPTDTPQRDQVVQFKDVGTRLSVRPTVSVDGYVMLQVTQEVNAATNETAFDAPVISTRSVQTQLLVKDNQTVVLGGLTDRQREVVHTGIPLLSDVPIVGGLFGGQSRRTVETELFVFLTPRVIRTDADADSVTAPRLEQAEKKKP